MEVASPQIELISPASPLQGPVIGHEGIRDFFREMWNLQCIDNAEIIETVHARRAPMVPVNPSLRP